MGIQGKRALVLGMVLSFVLAATGHVLAADGVSVKVAVIHAVKGKAPSDPALKKIEPSLRNAFGGYASFKQLDKQQFNLKEKGTKKIALPNAQSAEVRYDGQKGKKHMMRLTIPKSKVDVDLRAPARKMFYQAGMKYKGGILILAFYLKD